jgi:hypothetical protein
VSFKAGDRVRIIGNEGFYAWKGVTGTVIRVGNYVKIQIDPGQKFRHNGVDIGGSWLDSEIGAGFFPRHIELINRTPKELADAYRVAMTTAIEACKGLETQGFVSYWLGQGRKPSTDKPENYTFKRVVTTEEIV